jgi:hypothetical protein
MSASDLREREDFVIESSQALRNRTLSPQIAEAMNWNPADVRQHMERSERARVFQGLLFQRIVPNLKRLGLLSPRVREALAALGVLQFEDHSSLAIDQAMEID